MNNFSFSIILFYIVLALFNQSGWTNYDSAHSLLHQNRMQDNLIVNETKSMLWFSFKELIVFQADMKYLKGKIRAINTTANYKLILKCVIFGLFLFITLHFLIYQDHHWVVFMNYTCCYWIIKIEPVITFIGNIII